MSTVSIATDAGRDSSAFWLTNLSPTSAPTLTGLTSQAGSILGHHESTFSTLVVQSGDLAYHYIGSWSLVTDRGLFDLTAHTSGNYDRVEIWSGNNVVATADLPSIPVDFGTVTSPGLLGGVTDLVGGVLTPLLGINPSLLSLSNLTLGGTPGLPELAFGDGLTAIGGDGIDKLVGFAGNDTLDGGLGADHLIGGLGNDTYLVDNVQDLVTELLGQGTDLVKSTVSYVLGDGVENLELLGTGDLSGTGNALANILTGNAGNNILNGLLGADIMIGGLGDDTFIVDNVLDTVIELPNAGNDTIKSSVSYTLSANVENLVLTGTDAISGTGNRLSNTLTGNAAANTLTDDQGNDVLDGGAGADTLAGGVGNDTYIVDNRLDKVVETAGAGTDTVKASVSYALGANVENLVLTGTSNIAGTGNAGANRITGNAGNNVLDGKGGADTMAGGKGNDTYVVDNKLDKVVEGAGAGIDTVRSSIAYTLGTNVENLILTGTASVSGTGNALANRITGNAGNNVLDGKGGADTMAGGKGNDTYIVDNKLDKVVEGAGAGIDTVRSSIAYTLGANVENLILTGTASVSGTGNALANTITGNAGHNVLDGKAGGDKMNGGKGNDTYIVDNKLDKVVEGAGAGIDTVKSSVSYTLTSNVEKLILTGTGSLSGTGNALANTITGNAGHNVLDGKAGADTMSGGKGNDTYIVDNKLDKVVEAKGAGIDTVKSSVAYTLGANVEKLVLTGTAGIAGTGNDLANTITGNAGNNLIAGGLGKDVLTGGKGHDTFFFNTKPSAGNVDHITDFSAAQDTIKLEDSIFKALKPGTLDAHAFKDISTGKVDADDRILYNQKTGALYYDADGSGHAAKVQIAVLDNHAALSFHDFLIA